MCAYTSRFSNVCSQIKQSLGLGHGSAIQLQVGVNLGFVSLISQKPLIQIAHNIVCRHLPASISAN